MYLLVQEVRLSENPITDAGNGTAARFMILARIGKLTSLNGSQVFAPVTSLSTKLFRKSERN